MVLSETLSKKELEKEKKDRIERNRKYIEEIEKECANKGTETCQFVTGTGYKCRFSDEKNRCRAKEDIMLNSDGGCPNFYLENGLHIEDSIELYGF